MTLLRLRHSATDNKYRFSSHDTKHYEENMSLFNPQMRQLVVASCIALLSTASFACDPLKLEMAKDAQDPSGQNACLPRVIATGAPSLKDLQFLEQLALPDSDIVARHIEILRKTNVQVSSVSSRERVAQAAPVWIRSKTDVDLCMQMAGLDGVGC
jgi:hypothetical protein